MAGRARRALAIGGLTVGLSLTGCGSDAPQPREGTTIEEITGDSSGKFDISQAEAGQRASLRVTVQDVLSRDSFVVGSKDTAGAPLLVLTRGEDLEAGKELQVSGLLRLFDYEQMGGDHQLADDAAYAAYRGQLVLVADLVDDDLPLDGD